MVQDTAGCILQALEPGRLCDAVIGMAETGC